MASSIKVMIVDDEDLVRNGLELVIQAESDMTVVGTAKDGLEALSKLNETVPDIILMDIQMPRMNGIDCIKAIRQTNNHAIILVLTTFNEEDYIIEALASGANGYLLKGINFDFFLKNIRDAMTGQYALPVEVTAKLVDYIHRKEAACKKKQLQQLRDLGGSES